MDGQRKAGNELLAISHNANLSRRPHVSDRGRQLRAADRRAPRPTTRMRNEPLIEIKQTKGQSETHPLLSPNDEFANYKSWAYLLGDPQGRIRHIVGSYARQALKDGLALQETKGFNPYKFGFGGGSDSHYHRRALSPGQLLRRSSAAWTEASRRRMSGILFGGMDVRTGEPAGLTGVWAEENTRDSIFNAMQRKETFARQRSAHQGSILRRLELHQGQP